MLGGAWARIKGLWSAIPPAVWQGLAFVLAVIGILLYVNPFGSSTGEQFGDDASGPWNNSIRKLGLTPLYPPEEDYYVGDIWVAPLDTCDDSKQDEAAKKACAAPFRKKAVRIGHLDLRQAMERDPELPVFGDTAPKKEAEGYRPQNLLPLPTRPGQKRVRLSLAAFPGVTIDQSDRRSGSAAAGLFGFFAGRKDSHHLEIRIPTAETYGADLETALDQLMLRCKPAGQPAFRCEDDYVRKLASSVIGRSVYDEEKEEDKYILQLQLIVVVRVYLTRELLMHDDVADARLLQARVADPAAKPEAASAEGEGKAQRPATDTARAHTTPVAGYAADLTSAGGWGLNSNQTYQRPLVFGFRAITMAVAPSKPTCTSPFRKRDTPKCQMPPP